MEQESLWGEELCALLSWLSQNCVPTSSGTRESPPALAGESGKVLLHPRITFLTTPLLWFTNALEWPQRTGWLLMLLPFITLNTLFTVVNNELMNPKEDNIYLLFEHNLWFQLNEVDSRNKWSVCQNVKTITVPMYLLEIAVIRYKMI